MIGKSILHYKILEKLGEGGMGIVYLADDTKLKRKVAIKFLPPHIAANISDRERFKIEAQAAASLNHPNIATIHAIEEHNDEIFIVMEYIDGKELKDIISDPSVSPLAKGGLRGVLNLAIQIAKGLHAPHKKGIIHRDIKSSNIMVTEDGNVKIMDFGLARIGEGMQLTRTNSTMGTVAYMSPEQVQGESADPQSDIWSFGVVLYEMLTGKIPFEGKNEPAIIYSINSEQPCFDEIDNEALRAIVNKCLEKDKSKRYSSVAQLLNNLQGEKESSSVIIPLDVKTAKKKVMQSTSFKWASAISLIFMIALYFILFDLKQSKNLPIMKTSRFTSYPGEEYNPVISPDGQFVAFSWNGSQKDNFDIYIKRVVGGDPLRITTDPRIDDKPEWSPDGNSIAFIRKKELQVFNKWAEILVVPALGGREQKIIDIDPPLVGPMRSISWSKDNFIYYTGWREKDKGNVILKVSVETRESEQVTHLQQAMWGDQSPRISPNGNYLAFNKSDKKGFDIHILNLQNKETQSLTNINAGWINGFCWSSNSRFIFFAADLDGTSSLWKIDLEGEKQQKLISGNINNPFVSFRGGYLVYSEIYENSNIWKFDTHHPGNESLLINSSALHNFSPAISPDGKKIAFFSNRSGSYNVWLCDKDGSNQSLLTSSGDSLSPGNLKWSPDGSEILVNTDIGIYLLNAAGGHPLKITDKFKDGDWSANGNALYCSDQTEIFLLSRDGKIKNKVTKENGILPQVYGNYIYYLKGWYFRDIWRIPAEGGDEEPILQGVRDMGMNLWKVVKNGIYYIRKNNGFPLLEFFDFKTRKSILIKEMPAANVSQAATIDMDTKEQFLFFSKHEPTKSDIILVENFRVE